MNLNPTKTTSSGSPGVHLSSKRKSFTEVHLFSFTGWSPFRLLPHPHPPPPRLFGFRRPFLSSSARIPPAKPSPAMTATENPVFTGNQTLSADSPS
ncbi:unnamed protein product [Microthlaspi erraticum]|uniref:Uncharacterized protein n=1 Tax=Microthlaspi erraticum TaxID=1685480 RepID=A0A6D2L4C1_9BRAS|nr:unnamed protein product [Microthlaspi erraticum]